MSGEEAVKVTRRTFTPAFRRAAVKRIRAGESVPDVARELKVHDAVLYRWARKKVKPAKLEKDESALAIRDAITYLKHVKVDMYIQLHSGAIKEFEEYHLNTLAALHRLQSVKP